MLLDQVFDSFDHIKLVFIRKDGKLKKVKRSIIHDSPAAQHEDKPMFPISKER